MILYILLIAHLVGDFFLQSSVMAEKKKKEFKFLFIHSIIYSAVFLVVCFIFLKPGYAALAMSVISVTHFIIDFVRIKINSKINNHTTDFISFIVDQILHLGVIVAVYILMELSIHNNSMFGMCVQYSGFNKFVLYGLLFTVLLNPASVFIKNLFIFLFNNENDKSTTGMNAGSLIGKLERVITAILLLCNQYAVIGLVLTAKSIARFRQLEEKDFAEKYLIGTLLSLTISLVSTLAIKGLM